ncbi:MAG: TIGR02757 family protein [Campylobacterales bacterium]|nr:TIGR02757 family protein [Campylobacterales bacterium]
MSANSSFDSLKARLDAEAAKRNDPLELCDARPDPLLIAREQSSDAAILLCALYSYGNARLIVRFLRSFDFSLLGCDEAAIRQTLERHYYRFQNGEDVVQSLITLRRLGLHVSLYEAFMQGYRKEGSIIDGINALLDVILTCNPYRSRGYDFLFGARIERAVGHAPMKRWMMFLRWMVRSDALDLGRWEGIARRDLIMPLDTHTFKVSRALGLLERQRYDLQAAIELTCKLQTFDPDDPLRYDFALYRIGQEGMGMAML